MKEKEKTAGLLLGAIGIVYGDIGTSPLYVLKSCFTIGKLPVTPLNIFGLLSLIIWTIILIASVKYVSIVLRADNQGEGGILVLSSLCTKLKLKKYRSLPVFLGIIGMALFFGDGIITPAISVLSAVEGIKLLSPLLGDHILLVSLGIITGLFLIQRTGTGQIGAFFGPIMLVWFVTLAGIGAYNIFLSPGILRAINPYYAIQFLAYNGASGLVTMGGVILVVTGIEALYADLGHFGKKPIQWSWYFVVFPALLLNYLGQGGLLLHTPKAIANPFYLLVPNALLPPLIVLATLATIIASQSILTGVFSLSWQAIMMNYLPRMRVAHTSHHQIGQVYVPSINLILYFLTIGAILYFQSSDNLAVAYGLSVTGVMVITTFLVALLAYYQWQWRAIKVAAVFLPFFMIDVLAFSINSSKIVDGAWYALLITTAAAYIICVWIRGNKELAKQRFPIQQSLKSFLNTRASKFPQKIPGSAVFMCRSPWKVPNSLMIHLNHNKFLHEKTFFLSIITKDIPHVPSENKFSSVPLTLNAYMITAEFGFKEVPDFNRIIKWATKERLLKKDEEPSLFFSHGVPVLSNTQNFTQFSKKLYIFLSRNAISAYEFYKIPHSQVIELGVRYKI